MLSVLNFLSTKQKKYTEIVTCCHGPNDLDDPILKLPVSLTISIEKKSVDKSSITQYTFSIRRF